MAKIATATASKALVLPLVTETTLQKVLSHFPKQNTNFVFAYGSAVFAQRNQKTGKMLDLIFVVNNAEAWHEENLRLNWDDYSGLKYFGGPRIITKVQEKLASGVYYNPFVIKEGQLIKYGVITRRALEKDLRHWSHLYIAGRLQKPVLELMPPTTASLLSALKTNREAALRAVLLQEGRYLSKYTLYHGITELSYLGDSRMRVAAENPNKTRNIVLPLLKDFDKIYSPLLRDLSPVIEVNAEGLLIQDTRPQARFSNLMALPSQVQMSLCRHMFRDPRLTDIEEVMAELSYMPQLRSLVRNAIAEVVWSSSIMQTIQGLLSAGVTRSVRYALEKLQKGRLLKNEEKCEKEDQGQEPPQPPPPPPPPPSPPAKLSQFKPNPLPSPPPKSKSKSPS